tara:strand:- start:309 stop:731 length:423 start_codon:yes stop_codon:yes gene_type:complete
VNAVFVATEVTVVEGRALKLKGAGFPDPAVVIVQSPEVTPPIVTLNTSGVDGEELEVAFNLMLAFVGTLVGTVLEKAPSFMLNSAPLVIAVRLVAASYPSKFTAVVSWVVFIVVVTSTKLKAFGAVSEAAALVTVKVLFV